MEKRQKIADFHQDRVNPWIADILQNPDFKYTEKRRSQFSREGLSKIDLIFASLYRRTTSDTIKAAQTENKDELKKLKGEYKIISDYYHATDDFRIITNPSELQLQETPYQKNNVVLHLENGDVINEPGVVDELYEWGVRSVGLMYNHDNQLGGGAGSKSDKNRGLTTLGKEVVRRIMERGMIVDLAHCNEKTAKDILHEAEEYNKVVVSHTAIRTPNVSADIHPERLISEEILRSIAVKGGVVGFTPTTHFLPNLDTYINEFKKASDITGSTRNLAIGSDFGGLDDKDLFEGLKEIKQLSIIAELLSEKGNFSDEEIANIMFGNLHNLVKSL